MNSENNIEFFVLIADRKKKEDLLNVLSDAGGRIVNIVYGRGTVKANYLMEVFGLAPEESKIIITFLISKEKSDAILQTLVRKFNFDKPNTGIAFTIPVEGLSY